MDIAFNIQKNRGRVQCFKIDVQRNRMGDTSRNPDETVVFVKQDGLQAAVVVVVDAMASAWPLRRGNGGRNGQHAHGHHEHVVAHRARRPFNAVDGGQG